MNIYDDILVYGTTEVKHRIALRKLLNRLRQIGVTAKVIVDASPVGLGAMLVQTQNSGDDKVIAYASRSLNDAETRYSQIERECLAVHFGCTRFQMYLLGKNFHDIHGSQTFSPNAK